MNGILVINKSKGCTSHDIVKEVKKIFNEKVGHTGTLDPMATGVLPLLIGKGTLCSKYIINHDKTYHVVLELGRKTDTADSEGKVIEEAIVPKLERVTVNNILESFVGKQKQIPPMYSAIKLNGKKLYEYARKGINVEVKPREIEIYKISLLNINNEKNQIEFIVECSKGTYIRSLCEDIAKQLGTVGFMKELKRTKVGEFDISEAIEFKEITYENAVSKIITIENLFKEKPEINLNKEKLRLFLNGVQITKNEEDDVYKIYSEQKFIGTGVIKNKKLKRDIIL